MKLSTVINRAPAWYQARKSVYLTSAPGLGKTTVLSKLPERIGREIGKNLGLVIINGPLLTVADSVGYLIPKHREDGRAESLYTDPFWFRTREGKRLDEYDGGIVVVDEADKMDTDVKKTIGEAALSGRLGPHTLPDGWVVWMAGNRAEDRSGSTKELDHLINRRMEIAITPDLESWTDWAVGEGLMPITIAFAHQNPQIVFSGEKPDKQGPWCTPRSLHGTDEYLRILKGNGGTIPDDPTTIEEVGGMIGAGAAAQYFTFVRLDREMPKLETIIKDPGGAKTPQKPDAQMLVCYSLAHRVNKENCEPIIQYIERLPKEFSITFANAACKRDHLLIGTPAFQKWAKNNAALVALVSRL